MLAQLFFKLFTSLLGRLGSVWDGKKSLDQIIKKTKDQYVDLTQMKFQNPKQGDEFFEKYFNEKKTAIEERFKTAF